VSERELEQAVIDCARLLGWLVAHFRPAETRRGWRTAVAGDGKGFPDLVLVHPLHGVLWRELKDARGKVSTEQAIWLSRLEVAGENAAVWRPADWLSGRIERELRGSDG
jgi:VRR-NUC domain